MATNLDKANEEKLDESIELRNPDKMGWEELDEFERLQAIYNDKNGKGNAYTKISLYNDEEIKCLDIKPKEVLFFSESFEGQYTKDECEKIAKMQNMGNDKPLSEYIDMINKNEWNIRDGDYSSNGPYKHLSIFTDDRRCIGKITPGQENSLGEI